MKALDFTKKKSKLVDKLVKLGFQRKQNIGVQ